MEQHEVAEKLGNGYLRCRFMQEILGSPKEHVENTLRLVLQKLEEERDVEIVSGKVHPPELQDDKKMFSAYSETEVLFKNFEALTRICFDYMPSSIELLQPQDLKLSALEISNFVGDMLSLLHQIDFKLKDVNARNKLLEKNSANLLKNFILLSIESGHKSTGALAKVIGIRAEQLGPFLEAFTQENIIKKNGDLWEKI